MGIVSNILHGALSVLLPARCVGCNAGGAYLCAACLDGVQRPPLRSAHGAAPLAGVFTPFAYEGVARDAVHHLKYRGVRALAPEMARPMADALARASLPPFILVPVPLHRRRLHERGFNQAELLAREVARLLGAPFAAGALRRDVDTASQVAMPHRGERVRNVQDAFAVAQPPDSGASVVLVDDVTTTGATLASASRALLASGVARVYGLTFARED